MQDITATYSPDDNKLRLYPVARLDAETYARVKAAGYIWAPKQECFVAPMWTPAREDLALELAGEIDDEDKSLQERAEDRAERFSDYSDKRASDAEAARRGVAAIADNIPLGQPILIGHHSERHARRDAEHIESGMRRAVKNWETSEYWTRRAAGAIAAAQHKERPDVRARRIKTIEADARKVTKTRDSAAAYLRAWTLANDDEKTTIKRKDGAPTTFRERALHIADAGGYASYCFTLAEYPREAPASQYEGAMSLGSAIEGNVCTPEQAREIVLRSYPRSIAQCERWLAHYANRLAYERAMLAEGGGLAADKFDIQPGGKVRIRGRWSIVLRVNRKDGRALSVSVAGQSWTSGIEEVTDYEAPTETAAAAVASVTKLAPLANFDGGASFVKMTAAEYKAVYEGARVIKRTGATETHGAYRLRYVSGYVAQKFGVFGVVSYDLAPVFLTDAKVSPAPALGAGKGPSMARKIAEAAGVDTSGTPDDAPQAAPTLRQVIAEECAPTLPDVDAERAKLAPRREAREQREEAGAPFDAMRQALRNGGVQVVRVPQLFPTPNEIAARMIELADIRPGDRVLEPSAGTGALLGALGGRPWGSDCDRNRVHAVEIHGGLCQRLRADFPLTAVHCADFLAIDGPDAYTAGNPETDPAPLGRFDRVIMNPPFADGADMAHIRHAARFLAPGGVLVALCANGPRQAAKLRPWVEAHGGSWEPLPAGSFAEAGTGVNVALLRVRIAAAAELAA
jgi:protein-L-isoaspartate O-methyltransferase